MRREPLSHWAVVNTSLGQVRTAKVIYLEEQDAVEVAEKASRKGFAMMAYRCVQCGWWHIGKSRERSVSNNEQGGET